MKMSLIIEKFKFPQRKMLATSTPTKSHDKNPSYKVRDFNSFQYKIYAGSCLFKYIFI